jgi:acyl-CoA synthetase (AMP-forming)/AMP-acid ligase II
VPDDAHAGAFADGWCSTGDVGWLETEAWVHLTERSKEVIKVNGFQVAPAEVEAVLHSHPAVLDGAVFGIADERAGEVPVAAAQLDVAQPVAERELEGWWRPRSRPTSISIASSWSTRSHDFRRVRFYAALDEWTSKLARADSHTATDVAATSRRRRP